MQALQKWNTSGQIYLQKKSYDSFAHSYFPSHERDFPRAELKLLCGLSFQIQQEV